MHNLTLGSLCAGIGGFELAASEAGIQPIWSNEIDAYCCAVLRKNFAHTIIEDDIRNLKDLPYVDIISAGFPCQPFSVAGKRKGTEDNRYLWPQIVRIIRKVQPITLLLENVPGITSMEDGKVFEKICASLESQGYAIQTFIIPACATGAPHRRDRTWIIAHANSGTKRTTRDCQSTSNSRAAALSTQEWQSKQSPIFDTRCTDLPSVSSNSDIKRLQARTARQQAEKKEKSANKQSARCSQLFRQNWKDFPTQSPVRGANDGISRRMDGARLKALGNAIVPQVAYELFKIIIAMHEAEKCKT